MSLRPFASVAELSAAVAEILRPPRRELPSAACARFLRNHEGPWDPAMVPMHIEPLDLLAGRQYRGIVFVGPARGGKTYTLIIGGLAWAVTCSPADTLIVQMSKDKAREFSRKEIDRAIRNSPELAARLSPRSRDDNVHDKVFRSGMQLNIGWPAVTQLSGATFKYVFVTDYDRPENRDDVDGEGPMWGLGFKRVETFMSRGKMLAESSPGGEQLDAQWRPQSPHEAPPADGILAIYNQGTRARWYWQCQHCQEYFEAAPGTSIFALPPFEELEQEVMRRDLMWLAEQFARVPCPHCSGLHTQDQKRLLNSRGTWLHAGETISPSGKKDGERARTEIASYWQGGCSAAYQTWTSLLFRYFSAIRTYVSTGLEGPLKLTTNTDQAMPYLPRAAAKRRSGAGLSERAEEWGRGTLPVGVRFLTAAVDVQANRFVCEVHGWGVGLEHWVIERFAISASMRAEGDRYAAIDPSAYVEDWEVLVQPLLDHRFACQTGHELQVRLVLCDSGGRAGVTAKAYEFWRRLRLRGLGERFMLVRGDGNLRAPLVQLTWPDTADRKDRASGARGDVPVWRVNTNLMKDAVAGDLGREVPGPGFVHLPSWLDPTYYDELTAETRDAKGAWVKAPGARNESLDLHVYNRSAVVALKGDRIDWANPPEWACDPAELEARQLRAATAAAPAQTAPRSGYLGRRKDYLKR